jgi:predicted ATPase
MITAITLENFKGTGDKVRIELKPITLLFGENSAGKSTIIQALHYSLEILGKRNFDPNWTVYGGNIISLGGFKSLVHNQNLAKQIVMRFDIEFSLDEMPSYGLLGNNDLFSSLSYNSAWVEFAIKWDKTENAPVLSYYKTAVNNLEIAGVYRVGDSNVVKINEKHPIFSPENKLENNHLENWVSFPLKFPNSTLPYWELPISILTSEEGIVLGQKNFSEKEFSLYLNQVLVAPGQILTTFLENFCYLGAIRQVPTRNYQHNSSASLKAWAEGQAAWELLYVKGQSFLNEVNSWLSSERRLNTGYSIHMKKYKELDLDSPLMESLSKQATVTTQKLKAAIDKIPTSKRIYLKEIKSGLSVMPQDIGVGISQILPVVVAALNSKADHIVAIEQPELHIHPSVQVRLGDLFITQINHKNVTFLLETHSEHLLLRLLRRIRETNENRLPPNSLALTPDKISVIYLEQTIEGMKLTQLRIDETGEFLDRWPKGFFEERAEELF